MRGLDGGRDPHPRFYPGCGSDLVLQWEDFLPGSSGFRFDPNGEGRRPLARLHPAMVRRWFVTSVNAGDSALPVPPVYAMWWGNGSVQELLDSRSWRGWEIIQDVSRLRWEWWAAVGSRDREITGLVGSKMICGEVSPGMFSAYLKDDAVEVRKCWE